MAAIGRDDLAPASADFRDRLVPADALELLGALGADAPQRIFQPVGIGVMVVEVFQLHAERAARERMFLIAMNVDELAVLDLVDHGASVRTVVRTGAKKLFPCRLFVHASSLPQALCAALGGR